MVYTRSTISGLEAAGKRTRAVLKWVARGLETGLPSGDRTKIAFPIEMYSRRFLCALCEWTFFPATLRNVGQSVEHIVVCYR